MIKDKTPIQKGNYTILRDKFLGKGRHSVIYECVDQSDKQKSLCAKIISNIQLFRTIDVEKLKNIQHENLIQYHDIFQHNNDVIIIMDKCEGNLKTMIDKKCLTEMETINFIEQITKGYQQLIELDLEIRDLKPASILVKKDVFKITNYGISQLFKQVDGEVRAYSAPEIFYEPKQTRAKDMFSLGLLIYYTSFNSLPYVYRGAGDQLRFLNQLKDTGFLVNKETSPKIKDLIQNMVVYNSNERMTWELLMNQF